MANPTWPYNLPGPTDQGMSYEPLVENVISSSVETGAPKRRRRFTNVPDKATFTLVLTGEQCATLDTFVATTLKDVLPFDWKDFRSGASTTYVFIKRPSYRLAARDTWTATLELQVKL